jgi:hypothetical protein
MDCIPQTNRNRNIPPNFKRYEIPRTTHNKPKPETPTLSHESITQIQKDSHQSKATKVFKVINLTATPSSNSKPSKHGHSQTPTHDHASSKTLKMNAKQKGEEARSGKTIFKIKTPIFHQSTH